jgi:hypothetical protein
MNYLITMKNPKSGEAEAYTTAIDSADEIPLITEFWTGAGYEVMSFAPSGALNPPKKGRAQWP